MELATATLLSAEQTEPVHHFRLVHWLIPVLGKSFDLLGCQPVTQKFTACIIVQGGKNPSSSLLTVARRSMPPTFSIKGKGTDLLSAGSSVHILLPHDTYYPVSSRKVQNCWAADPAVQLPHGHFHHRAGLTRKLLHWKLEPCQNKNISSAILACPWTLTGMTL